MLFSSRPPQIVRPTAGSAYRRVVGGAMAETANVLEVGADRLGIPHVRFELQVRRGNGMPTVERRTLALEVFQSRYRQLVHAPLPLAEAT